MNLKSPLQEWHWNEKWPSNDRNDYVMNRILTLNGGMTVEWYDFRNQGFRLCSKISLHFLSIRHLSIIFEWKNCFECAEWHWNEISPIRYFISCHFRRHRMTQKWPNEEEWSGFWKGRKKLNSEMPFISLSLDQFKVIRNRNFLFHFKWYLSDSEMTFKYL